MTRTFIALEMNEDLQQHLAAIIQHMAHSFPSVRWVDPRGIHLTLSFLGELTDEQLAQAIQAAEGAARQVKPFTYWLARLGVFGSPLQPRVIWLGIEEPSGVLLHLHHLLNTALKQYGFAIGTRPFSPHLTLARVKAPLTQLEQQRLRALLVTKQQDIVSHQTYHVHHIVVMKSELLRTGARYTLLQQCMLAAR
ncbi:MAG: RNA 2',3'-cyclic phosphodiesterase [Ktedonobacteraceae bacterium]|nr:RNA 2',3'-cyclic phosphodiesterase [Ktedonobacteraceae bacterium]